MAPFGFTAVSTLMVNTYKQLGHGIDFIGAWSADAFFTAAILFVDDSDLLHMAMSLNTTDSEFFV